MNDWLKLLVGSLLAVGAYVFATGQGWGGMGARMDSAERTILQLQAESVSIRGKLSSIAEIQSGMSATLEVQSDLLREIRDDLRGSSKR